MPQQQPTPRKPIKVVRGTDARLKNYQDSMFMYNSTKKLTDFIKAHPNYDAMSKDPKAYDEFLQLDAENGFGPKGSGNPSQAFDGLRTPKKPLSNTLVTWDDKTNEEVWNYAKPVQPYVYEKPKPTRPLKPSKTGNISEPDSTIRPIEASNPISSVEAKQTPTPFSFTGRQGNNQVTRYFPDLDTWKAATDQFGYRSREITNDEKEAHATGYEFENGGDMGQPPITRLNKIKEQQYQQWRSKLPHNLKYEGDYDLRGLWLSDPNIKPSENLHFPDTYKLPNHPTFSNESKYFNSTTKPLAGHWQETDSSYNYIPYDPKIKDTVIEKKLQNGGAMRNLLFRRYQRALPTRANGGAVPYGQLGQLGAEGVDLIAPPDNLGFQSTGASTAKGALKGAGTGAAIGSVVPGIGTAVGAVAGTVIGATAGFVKGRQNSEKERNLRGAMAYNAMRNANNFSAAQLSADPSLAIGTNESSYFANGGAIGGSMQKYVKKEFGGTTPRSPMTDMVTSGGSAQPLSSDNALIKGLPHSEGGVKMDGLDTEVEGGETTLDNYVFSKKLGFADLHLPIARAKGKIEKKPRTLERANSLRLLMQREQNLKQQQEQFKQINGLQ